MLNWILTPSHTKINKYYYPYNSFPFKLLWLTCEKQTTLSQTFWCISESQQHHFAQMGAKPRDIDANFLINNPLNSCSGLSCLTCFQSSFHKEPPGGDMKSVIMPNYWKRKRIFVQRHRRLIKNGRVNCI